MSSITPKPGMTVEISMGIEKSLLDAIEAAESLRKANEAERADAELMRKEGEAGRITAEQERTMEEDARNIAESGRANAEQQRVESEKQRENAESARVTAESGRANAEALRQQTFEANEANRHTAFESAENARESEWTEIKSDVESSVGSAVASASAATDAANTAADNANAAAEKSVRYDVAQTLSDAQKAQARGNIDAADEESVDSLKGDIEQLENGNILKDNTIKNYNIDSELFTERRMIFDNYELKENTGVWVNNNIPYESPSLQNDTVKIMIDDIPDTLIFKETTYSNGAVKIGYVNKKGKIEAYDSTYLPSSAYATYENGYYMIKGKKLKSLGTISYVYLGAIHGEILVEQLTKYPNGGKKSLKWLYSQNIITVGKNGVEDFTKIQDAINYASDGYTIFVSSGEYEEHIDLGTKLIRLIGANPLDTVVFDTSGEYSNAPIICGQGFISGFTFYAKRLDKEYSFQETRRSYAMHLDQRWGSGKRKIYIDNCIFKNDFSGVIGCGVIDDVYILLNNCRVIATVKNTSAFQIHGADTGTSNATIEIRNCIMETNPNGNGVGLLLSNGGEEYNIGTTLTIKAHGNRCSFYNNCGNLFILDSSSWGNSATELNAE